jgi:polysaccharide pyruvyl transferase WcaK-like protein
LLETYFNSKGIKMKVLLNGATAGTNFGDYLFAEMYQNHIANSVGKNNVCWYENRFAYSDFYKKYLKNKNKYKLKDIDALVYMPGGYFCGQSTKIKNYLIVFLTYFKIGLKCLRRKIPYAILGMEVAHSKSKIIERIQKKLLVNASVVAVRNQDSYEVAKSYGVKNLHCVADNVFAMNNNLFEGKDIPQEIKEHGRKKIFFHINPTPLSNCNIIEKVLPILNRFLESHSEYDVLVSADQYYQDGHEEIDNISKLIKSKQVLKYDYNDPVALCKIIDCCDLVITTKLHVGIVGAKLGKSVVSFSGHTEKIKRLYKQLGEEERTTPLKSLTIEKGLEILNKFHDKPILVSEEIVEKANKNFVLLDEFLNSVKAGINKK